MGAGGVGRPPGRARRRCARTGSAGAGIVESYREAAGITDPAQAIGPVPTGQAQLREAFHSSVVALELPDDQALLRAMGRGELEATVAAHDRAAALAPREVQAEIGERERDLEAAQDRAHQRPVRHGRGGGRRGRGATPRTPPQDLARLAVADAARREWAEAHAGRGAGRPGSRRRAPAPGPGRAGTAGQRAAQEQQARPTKSSAPGLTGWSPRPRDASGCRRAEPEPEPQPELLSEAEFQAKLDRIVADAEARAAAGKTAALEAVLGTPSRGGTRADG